MCGNIPRGGFVRYFYIILLKRQQMDLLRFKDNSLAIKDVDLSKRTVVGYFSAFGNKDSDGDIIVRGAYAKTIKENFGRIAHLRQHRIADTIGKLQELTEDEIGLRFVSKLSESTLGNDTLIQYQEGILREHSVGFQIVKGEYREDPTNADESYYEIQEVKMWEGSTVTFGANPMTPVVDIKTKGEQLTEATERLAQIKAFIKNGKVSDEAFRLLEFEVLKLETILALDLKEEPPGGTPPGSEPQAFDFDKFKNFVTS